ncbi:MAG TPA: SCP2 sterol-binding domain-containing protein [Acidimicrobiales bacterium]
MADFLSAEWFSQLNETLRNAGPLPLESDASIVRVVLEFPDAPKSSPHALTFTMSAEGASVEPGDHLAADAIVQLSYVEATSLSNGTTDSASALRDGRVKVRGDINAIVPVLGWLQRSHPSAN